MSIEGPTGSAGSRWHVAERNAFERARFLGHGGLGESAHHAALRLRPKGTFTAAGLQASTFASAFYLVQRGTLG